MIDLAPLKPIGQHLQAKLRLIDMGYCFAPVPPEHQLANTRDLLLSNCVKCHRRGLIGEHFVNRHHDIAVLAVCPHCYFTLIC